MKCEKCKGQRFVMAMGWQKKRCPVCHGVGVITVKVEELKKKRGRPRKEK